MSLNPCDDAINECWVCRELFADGDGYSLVDGGEPVICCGCWEELSGFHRILLTGIFRTLDQGGLGVRELFRTALEAYPFSQIRPSRQ